MKALYCKKCKNMRCGVIEGGFSYKYCKKKGLYKSGMSKDCKYKKVIKWKK